MDWFEDFDVALDIPTKELMFVIERQRYKTFVEFERDGNGINCISGIESQDMRYLGAEGLSAEILCNAVNETTVSDILLEKEFRQGKEQVEAYLERHPGVVFTDEKNATRTDLVQCKLWMKNAKPIRTRVRPLNPKKRTALQKEVDDLLAARVIRPSKSVYASAPVLVKKKNGTWRLAIDYRRINQDSEDFPYPLPLIRELFNAFHGAQCYSSIDLARGYWQIGMDPEFIQYTAFVTQWGQFEFLVMPFGLKQAPGWFQLLMNEVLRPVLGKCAVVYLDDVIIFSRDPKQHVKDVIKVLELIRQAHLQIKL